MAWCLTALVGCGDDEDACESTCGDGMRTCQEACDDGNNQDGDGCSSLCVLEDGPCPDADEDGYRAARCGGDDCDDANPEVHPGAEEVSCNGLDDDCNPSTPDLLDADEDGVSCDLDCDDSNPDVHPGAEEEVCNGLDDDCDPSTPEVVDEDQDTFDCRLDCNDRQASVNPDASEVCGNGFDDDCNGATDCEDIACAELPICRGRRGGAFGGSHAGRVTIIAFHHDTELPVEDLEVLLESRGQLIAGRTSTAGQARFTEVPSGAYTITVRADGWRAVSIVGSRAARLEIPIEQNSAPTALQTLEVSNLGPELVDERGLFFAQGHPTREVLVRSVDETPTLDADPETEVIEPLSLRLPAGAPSSLGLRFDGAMETSRFAFVSVKEVPEPSLRATLSEEPIWSVSGRIEAEALELVGGTLSLSAFVHAGVFGDLPGSARTTRAVIQSSSLAVFGEAQDSALQVVAPPDLLDVTVVATFERAVGFELARSEQRIRRSAGDLHQPVVFEDLRPPPAFLAVDQSTQGRPSFGWDADGGPEAGEGLYELRIYEADGSLLRRLWVAGGADGVSIPLGATLPAPGRLRVEVRAHVMPGLDFDDFRWSELERSTTHVLSRELEIEL